MRTFRVTCIQTTTWEKEIEAESEEEALEKASQLEPHDNYMFPDRWENVDTEYDYSDSEDVS